MTIPVSTVPAVKSYMRDGIMDALTGDIVPGFALVVCYDRPGQYRPPEIVVIGKIYDRRVEGFSMVGSGGAGWLKEDYEFEAIVDVFRPGESLQVEAYERAWHLMSVVETVVRTDPSLGGLVIRSRPDRSYDDSEWERDGKGWIVSVTTRFTVCAQI